MPSKRVTGSPLDRANGLEVVWPQVSELFDGARILANPKFVYFIGEEDGGPVKIGLAKDPVQRLRGMQTGNPRRLRVEYVLLGDMPIEKLLHELWEPFAIPSSMSRGKVNAAPGTEWFRPEIRDDLYPIIEAAIVSQLTHLRALRSDDVLVFDALERIVRDAHWNSGFTPKGRDEVRLLGKVAGYSVNRPSRI